MPRLISTLFKPPTHHAVRPPVESPLPTWGLPFSKPQLSGLTRETLRRHYGIIPMMVALATALTFGVLTIAHELKGPDIELARHKNPEPWQEFHDRQFKLLKSGRDYSEPGPAPKY